MIKEILTTVIKRQRKFNEERRHGDFNSQGKQKVR